MIFLDLSDAFDSVSHKRLLNKLKNYNIKGLFLDIISDTFEERQQIVKYKDTYSDVIDVISGVFQGGVISPTLFNVYLSDIVNQIQSYIQVCR